VVLEATTQDIYSYSGDRGTDRVTFKGRHPATLELKLDYVIPVDKLSLSNRQAHAGEAIRHRLAHPQAVDFPVAKLFRSLRSFVCSVPR
jgi:hypothetical protein